MLANLLNLLLCLECFLKLTVPNLPYRYVLAEYRQTLQMLARRLLPSRLTRICNACQFIKLIATLGMSLKTYCTKFAL